MLDSTRSLEPSLLMLTEVPRFPAFPSTLNLSLRKLSKAATSKIPSVEALVQSMANLRLADFVTLLLAF